MFSRKVGKMDPGARIILGLALIAGFFANPDASYSWLYLLGGAIGLFTAALGSCGVHSLLSGSTCKAGRTPPRMARRSAPDCFCGCG